MSLDMTIPLSEKEMYMCELVSEVLNGELDIERAATKLCVSTRTVHRKISA